MKNASGFSLLDQEEKIHNLSDYFGKWVVLYFYPKDDTPGCTAEACSFRDANELFRSKGVTILGVSKDTVASHKKFAEKYHLTFPLLSDQDHTVIEAYGFWQPKKFMGKEFMGIVRATVLINPEGKIAKTYPKVDPLKHVEEILEDLKQF